MRYLTLWARRIYQGERRIGLSCVYITLMEVTYVAKSSRSSDTAGTCAMRPRDAGGVVDPSLKVQYSDLKGLHAR